MKELCFPWTLLCNRTPPLSSPEMITEISSVCIFADCWIGLLCYLGLDLAVCDRETSNRAYMNYKFLFCMRKAGMQAVQGQHGGSIMSPGIQVPVCHPLSIVSIFKVTSWSRMATRAPTILSTSQARHRGRREVLSAFTSEFISFTRI